MHQGEGGVNQLGLDALQGLRSWLDIQHVDDHLQEGAMKEAAMSQPWRLGLNCHRHHVEGHLQAAGEERA